LHSPSLFATEDPRSNEIDHSYYESRKSDPWPLDEVPRQKWQIAVKVYMPMFWRENKIGLIYKKELKKRVHDLKKQDAS